MTDTTRATNPRFAGGAVGTGGTDGTDVERALEAELVRLMQIESFDPPPDFAAGALHDTSEYDRAAADPLAFWAEQARALDWEDTGQAIVAFVTWPVAAPVRTTRSSSCATTWPAGSGSWLDQSRSFGRTTCPRRGPARSCAGCCGTSPKGGSWAM